MDNPKSEIQQWWASNPMTYGTTHGTTAYEQRPADAQTIALGTKEFFEQADRRFYSWNLPLHAPQRPFGKLFDYARYKGKQVLELGCGMGCMAMNWAQHGACITATDLNPIAIAQTKRRLELFGLSGVVQQMDAEQMNLPDNSFDFCYSWGVLHHSPNLKKSIQEIHRVLKPGARTGVMLYNRNSLLYRYTVKILEGYVHMESEFLNEMKLASRYGDGGREEGNPHTWPVTRDELIHDLFTSFEEVKVKVLGTDVDHVIDLAFPRLGSRMVPRAVLKALARRWGWSLWITARKA